MVHVSRPWMGGSFRSSWEDPDWCQGHRAHACQGTWKAGRHTMPATPLQPSSSHLNALSHSSQQAPCANFTGQTGGGLCSLEIPQDGTRSPRVWVDGAHLHHYVGAFVGSVSPLFGLAGLDKPLRPRPPHKGVCLPGHPQEGPPSSGQS